ncbi:MAG: ScpA family protein [Candidatus Diapherotrites archaeon]|nr:ScpA family protein [Candidatus Diapherotrites archaeon]
MPSEEIEPETGTGMKGDFWEPEGAAGSEAKGQQCEIELPEQVNLVDLIEQPAWKTILIELVKRNRMNPWDIDIVQLADLFLQKVQAMQKGDLRIPANAILASAILLKLKARTIKLSSLDEEEEAVTITKEELQLIEETIPELSGQRQFREGNITLDELVMSIEQILQQTKERKSILREKELPQFDLAFDRVNIEERIGGIFDRIKERADSQGLVMFSALLDENTPLEMVNCFIPVLFLMNKGKVNAWQEQWFGEIFISLLNEAAQKAEESAGKEALETAEKEIKEKKKRPRQRK